MAANTARSRPTLELRESWLASILNELFEELSVPQRHLVVALSRTSGPSLCRDRHSPITPVASAAGSAAVAAVPTVPMDSVTVEADLGQPSRPNQRPGTKRRRAG
jgi:hypothetical protein